MSEHQPCPWCRTNEHLEIDLAWVSDQRFVWCSNCYANGPRRDTPDEAWAAWDAWQKDEVKP